MSVDIKTSYAQLSPTVRNALSRFGVVDLPLDTVGVERVTGLSQSEVEYALKDWTALGFLERVETPRGNLYAANPHLRGILRDTEHLRPEDARIAHSEACAIFREIYESNPETTLVRPRSALLRACVRHAEAAENTSQRRWAVLETARNLRKESQAVAALDLLEVLLKTDRSYEVLHETATQLIELARVREARALLDEEVRLCDGAANKPGEARALYSLALLDRKEGNDDSARERFEKALSIREAVDDQAGVARTSAALGDIALKEQRYGDARVFFARSLGIWDSLGKAESKAASKILFDLGTIDVAEGKHADARPRLERSLALRRSMDDRAGEVLAARMLAGIDLTEERFVDARARFDGALIAARTIGDAFSEVDILQMLAMIDIREGKVAESQQKLESALVISTSKGIHTGVASALDLLGSIDAAGGRLEEARGKLQEALCMSQEIGDRDAEANIIEYVGSLAWKRGKKELGELLWVVSQHVASKLHPASTEMDIASGLIRIAKELGLGERDLMKLLPEAINVYRQDRAADLIRDALT